VMKAVKAFSHGAPQADDITMLGLRYHGITPSGAEMDVFRQTMPNHLTAIPVLQMAFEEYVAQWPGARPLIPALNMALDDLLNNVVQYAFANDSVPHHIVVEGDVRDGSVVLTITDDGIPFNPLTVAAPDFSLLLHEREIGGLGIHLVRSMFDEIVYRRTVGHNVLMVKKKLASKEPPAPKGPDITRIGALEGGRLPQSLLQDSRREGMNVESRQHGAVVIVTPLERFDTNSAPEVERILMDHISHGVRQLVLDLSRISYISSIGVRVIVKTLMAMSKTGGNVVLCGGNDHVRTVIHLSGALMMSLHVPTLEEAMTKVQGADF